MTVQLVESYETSEITTTGGVLMNEHQETRHETLPITILSSQSNTSDLAYKHLYFNSGKEEGNTLYVSNSPSIFELTERMITLEQEFGYGLSSSKGSINILNSNYEDNFISDIEREFIRLLQKGERPDLVLIDSWPANEDLECLVETLSDMQEYLDCEILVITSNQLLN